MGDVIVNVLVDMFLEGSLWGWKLVKTLILVNVCL